MKGLQEGGFEKKRELVLVDGSLRLEMGGCD